MGSFRRYQSMNRGDDFWDSFDPQLGSEFEKTRPAVVVGADVVNANRRTVLVMPLTATHTETLWPVMVGVKATGPACAVVDQVKACDKARFQKRIGKLTPTEMSEIDSALRAVLAL